MSEETGIIRELFLAATQLEEACRKEQDLDSEEVMYLDESVDRAIKACKAWREWTEK